MSFLSLFKTKPLWGFLSGHPGLASNAGKEHGQAAKMALSQLSTVDEGRQKGRQEAAYLLATSLYLQPCTSWSSVPAVRPGPRQLCASLPSSPIFWLLSSSRQQPFASNHQEKPSVSLGQCFPLSQAVLLHK